jgi:hypothetical protein
VTAVRVIVLLFAAIVAGSAVAQPATLEDTGLRTLIRRHHRAILSDEEDRIVALHRTSEIFRKYDRNFNGQLDPEEVVALNSDAASAAPQPVVAAAGRGRVKSVRPAPVAAAAPEPDKRPIGTCAASDIKKSTALYLSPEGDTVVTPLIRKSFADIFLFDCPTKAAQAEGAELSVLSDNLTRNTTWSASGMAALVYQHYGTWEGMLGFSMAPYVQVDEQRNSKLKFRSKDTDVVTAGLSAEIGFDAGAWSHYTRLRASSTSDQVKGTSSGTLTAEWIPVACSYNTGLPIDIGCPNTLPGTIFLYRFSPELVVQYDGTFGSNDVLAFSNRQTALRIGPQFNLILQPLPKILERSGLTGPIFTFLSNLSAHLTYHIYREVYSDRNFSYLETALVYNIDPAGHAGIKASYTKGRQEQTGDKIDQFKLALTVKY